MLVSFSVTWEFNIKNKSKSTSFLFNDHPDGSLLRNIFIVFMIYFFWPLHTILIVISFSFLANVLNDRLYKRFSELSRLATNIECIDQLMDLMRMQNSMDEILTLISQATSPQVHARIGELLHTLLNVRIYLIKALTFSSQFCYIN